MRSRRIHHCRGCRGETFQERVASENGNRPAVDTWRCRVCGLQILSLPAGVPDVEGLVLEVARRAGSARLPVDERAELLGYLHVETWAIYRKFDPARGVPLLAFLTGNLRLEVINWWRDEKGRNPERPKAHWGAVSLDELEERTRGYHDAEALDDFIVYSGGFPDPLGAALGEGSSDRDESSLADLRRTLARRGGDVAREERAMGLGTDARAPLGDPSPV